MKMTHSAPPAQMDASGYGSGSSISPRAVGGNKTRAMVGLALKILTETAILKSICAEIWPRALSWVAHILPVSSP